MQAYLGSGSRETGLKANPGRETGQEDNTFAATAPLLLEYLLNELQRRNMGLKM